jgi:hypothetical protein
MLEQQQTQHERSGIETSLGQYSGKTLQVNWKPNQQQI